MSPSQQPMLSTRSFVAVILDRNEEMETTLQVKVSFDKRRFAELLDALTELPAPIKPEYFGEEETFCSDGNRVDDKRMFADFAQSHPTGFFLFSDEWLYQIFTAGEGPARFTAYCSALPSETVLRVFFEVMASLDVPFALAANEKEYEHRNRIYHTIGVNHIESWVGRDIRKYVPGLYWYTMASASLLQEHKVNVSTLSANAFASERLGNCYLFKFFAEAEVWEKHSAKLDELCATTEGVFSSHQVSEDVDQAKNVREYFEIVGQWK